MKVYKEKKKKKKKQAVLQTEKKKRHLNFTSNTNCWTNSLKSVTKDLSDPLTDLCQSLSNKQMIVTEGGRSTMAQGFWVSHV